MPVLLYSTTGRRRIASIPAETDHRHLLLYPSEFHNSCRCKVFLQRFPHRILLAAAAAAPQKMIDLPIDISGAAVRFLLSIGTIVSDNKLLSQSEPV